MSWIMRVGTAASISVVLSCSPLSLPTTAAFCGERRWAIDSSTHVRDAVICRATAASRPADRRAFFLSSVVTTTAAATIASFGTFAPYPKPALADVSDGNALPPGAAEFSRLLKLKSDFANIGKRVAENSDEIDAKEWEKISQYLRTVYSGGEDMKAVSKGMYDPEKKKRAGELAKLIQKAAQAGEIPASQKNSKSFLVIQEKVAGYIDEFFDLLQDVPDEI